MENLAFFTRSLKKSKLRFTLVELIIVITILAILGTIGFMSFSSYVSDARDTNRVITIKSIQSGLDMYSTLKSSLPNPDNALTLSGGTGAYIKQGIIGKSVSSTIKLTNDVKDPKTNKEYVYSISGNGNYYQIGADLENAISYNNFTNQAYAEQTKAYVKGNYSFDPSLPSLITITGSVNTNSGIFDPNVCFVIDGGTNLVTSSSGTCTAKYKMSLKDYDSSLVGYWDMETTTGGLLKDLSGNNNSGTGFGGITIGGTGGINGKATEFDGINDYISINHNTSIDLGGLNSVYTVNYNFNVFSGSKVNIILAKALGSNENYPIYSFTQNNSEFWSSFTSTGGYLSGKSYRIGTKNLNLIIPRYYNISVIYDRRNNDNLIKLYINGYLINESIYYNLNNSIGDSPKNSQNLRIGFTGSPSWYFNGIIDDIKIYNRALSDSEIAQQAKIAGF